MSLKRSIAGVDAPLAKKSRMTRAAAPAGAAPEIDEDLHSRQLAVYGRESMRRMAASNILIVGVAGLGVEIGAPAAYSHVVLQQCLLQAPRARRTCACSQERDPGRRQVSDAAG